MITLYQLQIKGIRSYNHAKSTTIQFDSPVTIILGPNGSGKTTIVECLRYAVTGNLPPNTAKEAFVRDVKLTGDLAVDAEVVLLLQEHAGQFVKATRTMRVRAPNTLKDSVKENAKNAFQLARFRIDQATRKVTSWEPIKADMYRDTAGPARRKDVDTGISRLLGVSQACLENVILCHQEHAQWPLSEPGVLKTKLDEIFDMTKYRKFIEKLIEQQKALNKEIAGTKRPLLTALRREKDYADNLKERIAQTREDISKKEAEQEECEESLAAVSQMNANYEVALNELRDAKSQVEKLESALEELRTQLETRQRTLEVIQGTDEDLEVMHRNFDADLADLGRQRTMLEAEVSDLQDKMDVARAKHTKMVHERAQLVAEAKAQEAAQVEVDDLVRNLAVKYDIAGAAGGTTEIGSTFLERLTELRDRKVADIEGLESKQKRQDTKYNAEDRRLHAKYQGYRQEINHLCERINKLRTQITSNKGEVAGVAELDIEWKELEASNETEDDFRRGLARKIDDALYDERLQEISVQAGLYEAQRAGLTAELQALSSNAAERGRLTSKQEQLLAKEEIFSAKNEECASEFRAVFGPGKAFDLDTLAEELEHVLLERRTEFADAEQVENDASKEHHTMQTLFDSLQTQLQTKIAALEHCDEQLKQALNGQKSLDVACKEAREEIDTRQKHISSSQGAWGVFKRLLHIGESRKQCPLCTRDMNLEELRIYEQTVSNELEQSSEDAMKESNSKLEVWKAELTKLETLGLVAAERRRLMDDEIPALKAQIAEKGTALDASRETANAAGVHCRDVKKALNDAEAIRMAVDSLQQLRREIQTLQAEVASIEKKLRETGTTRSVEEVRAALEIVQSRIRAHEDAKQSLTTQRDRQLAALHQQENELNGLRLRMTQVKVELDRKRALEKSIEEDVAEVASCESQIEKVQARTSEVEAMTKELKSAYETSARESAASIQEAELFAQRLNRDVDGLRMRQNMINRYPRKSRQRQLESCEADMSELDAEIASLIETQDEARRNIARLSTQINQSNSVLTNLRDNRAARELARRIASLEERIAAYDRDENGQKERDLQGRLRLGRKEEVEMQSKYARLGGQLASKNDELRRDEEEFDLKYGGINKRYRDALIDVKLSEMASNDLGIHAKQAEKAIVKYQALKLDEVNQTMQELWHAIYQGSDIDHIKLVLEKDPQDKTRRDYKYRVVMTKNDADMDMRGRGSGGQRMLASIIIRLALADSFAPNCKMFALDEPTLALDGENVDALADALIRLIKERKRRENLQLIVITHDNHFLQKLRDTDVEYYWNVGRDGSQMSVVEQTRIADRRTVQYIG